MLDHERLDVYQCALRFAALSLAMAKALPRGQSELADQLRRASMSIPLNIAEGVGKPTLADRRRFFAIARGSALECAAIVDICLLLGIAGQAESDEAKALATRLVAMLTKLCR